jgi:hypothetical protein
MAPHSSYYADPKLTNSEVGSMGDSMAVGKFQMDERSPEVLIATYYAGDQGTEGDNTVRTVTLTSQSGAITFPGCFKFEMSEQGGSSRTYEFDVKTRGEALLDIELRADDQVICHGMGLRDDDHPTSFLVSWWWGEVVPAGIVKYKVVDGYNIAAHWTSVMSATTGDVEPKTGLATGPTGDGFPGSYSITYFGYGDATWGPFAWEIEERGDVFDLRWTQNGLRILNGFGFLDPDNPDAIIVNYQGAQ